MTQESAKTNTFSNEWMKALLIKTGNLYKSGPGNRR